MHIMAKTLIQDVPSILQSMMIQFKKTHQFDFEAFTFFFQNKKSEHVCDYILLVENNFRLTLISLLH